MARFRNNEHQIHTERLYERRGLIVERVQRFDQSALLSDVTAWQMWSFRITLGGTRYIQIQQRSYTLAPNTICWNSPLRDPVRLRWLPGTGSDVVVVSCSAERWGRLLADHPAFAQRHAAMLASAAEQPLVTLQVAPPQALRVLRQLIAFRAAGSVTGLALDNHAALLLALISELHFGSQAVRPEHERRRVEIAQAQMVAQLARPPKLHQIAEVLSVSERQLQRDFLSCTGMTPMRYLNVVRLSEANFLLAETALPIAEIASLLGYATPGHFSAAFRQAYQCSPRQVRASIEEARCLGPGVADTQPCEQGEPR
jgi:AraC-like DNA-binding protein